MGEGGGEGGGGEGGGDGGGEGGGGEGGGGEGGGGEGGGREEEEMEEGKEGAKEAEASEVGLAVGWEAREETAADSDWEEEAKETARGRSASRCCSSTSLRSPRSRALLRSRGSIPSGTRLP